MNMAKSFNNIFRAPETVYNRPLSFPVGVQPINSAPFIRPGGFVAPLEMEKFPIVDRPANPPGWPPRAIPIAGPRRPPVPVVGPGPVRGRPVNIIRPPAEVPLDLLDRPYTCVHPSSFDSANNCLKGGGTYKSNKPCGPVADSVAAPMCPERVEGLLGDRISPPVDSEGVLCSGPNFSGATTNCPDGSRPAVDCNNKSLGCTEIHRAPASNCADVNCTAVMVDCKNGGQAPNLPYYDRVTNQCVCRGACNPITDPPSAPPVVGGCNGDQACKADTRQCLDGQWKGRNPCNNCDFFPCGAPGNFTYQPLAKVFVPPNPNNNKDTLFARDENNLSLPLAKLNMTREEMGDVLVSNMTPARYAQELMNQRDIPRYVGPSTAMPPAPHTTFDVAMADGRNQRMTFPNGPICGKGGKQTVFSNSLVVNDWFCGVEGPQVFICTFSNNGITLGGGGKKPKVLPNPRGDCNLPLPNNGILAGALPVLSLVAASNFSDVGVGEAPASIPTRLVRPVSEPLPILKDREVSSFLVAKSNSVARNGNAAGLDEQIDDVNADLLIYQVFTETKTAAKISIMAQIDAKNLELAGLAPYLGTTCDTYYRAPQPSTMPTGQYPAATLTTTCVEHGMADCPGLYSNTGPSQLGPGNIQTGIVYQVYMGSDCVISENGVLHLAILRSLIALTKQLADINDDLAKVAVRIAGLIEKLRALEAKKLLLGDQIIT